MCGGGGDRPGEPRRPGGGGGGGGGDGLGPQRLAGPPQGWGDRGPQAEQEDGGSAWLRSDGARRAVRLWLPAQAPPRVSNEAAISSAACKINVIGIMLQFDLSTGFN